MIGSISRLRWILSPSLISGPTAFIGACFLLGSAGWSYITNSQLFYEELFGAYGAVTILQIQPYSLAAFQSTILNGPATYYVLLIAGSVIAGLSIYVVLEAISLLARGATLFLREVHTDSESARAAARESLVRLGVRVLGLLAWALYWLIFMNVILPFHVATTEQAITNIGRNDIIGWIMIPVIAVSFTIAVHLHATFARLIFLRVRLLGGLGAELSRIESSSTKL